MQITSFDLLPQLTFDSLVPCNFMVHGLVKLNTTPQQIPTATQGLLHFEGSMDQFSTGANRVLPFTFSFSLTVIAMYTDLYY
jgi:hypothetical protein